MEDCVLGIANGEMEYFQTLYDGLFESLYKYIYLQCDSHHLSEDITQETFVKIINSANTYKKGSHPKAWIFKIAKNQLIYHFRKHKSELLMDTYPDEAPESNIEFEMQQIHTIMLRDALSNLLSDEREIVILHSMCGLRFREIKDICERPMGTVTGIYRRAISKLHSLLTK